MRKLLNFYRILIFVKNYSGFDIGDEEDTHPTQMQSVGLIKEEWE